MILDIMPVFSFNLAILFFFNYVSPPKYNKIFKQKKEIMCLLIFIIYKCFLKLFSFLWVCAHNLSKFR